MEGWFPGRIVLLDRMLDVTPRDTVRDVLATSLDRLMQADSELSDYGRAWAVRELPPLIAALAIPRVGKGPQVP